MTRIIQVIFSVISFIGGFKFSLYFFTNDGYYLLSELLGVSGHFLLSNMYFMIVVHVFFASICVILIFQIIGNHFYNWFVYTFPVIYFLFAFGLVLLKSRGVQGVNLNLLSVVDEFLLTPKVILFNLIVFVPYGAIIATRHFNVAKTLGIGFISFSICEIVQFIFHLGIFDINDIILNLFGYLFGYFFTIMLYQSGVRFIKKPDKGYKFVYVK